VKPIGFIQAFNFIIVSKMECNQKKPKQKPIQSASNVDIDNLVKLYFISSEETNTHEEVNLLKLANLCEKLVKLKSAIIVISFVNGLKLLIDYTLSFDEKLITIFQFYKKLTLVSELLRTLILASFLISPLCIVGSKLSHEFKA
jgi:hypothetical protein